MRKPISFFFSIAVTKDLVCHLSWRTVFYHSSPMSYRQQRPNSCFDDWFDLLYLHLSVFLCRLLSCNTLVQAHQTKSQTSFFILWSYQRENSSLSDHVLDHEGFSFPKTTKKRRLRSKNIWGFSEINYSYRGKRSWDIRALVLTGRLTVWLVKTIMCWLLPAAV